MGYSYGRGGLCCDKCGKSGGVRKRACPFKVRGDSLRTIGGRRHVMNYCYPPALCAPCYAELGGQRGIHGDTCRDGAARSQAEADAIEAGLDAGEMYVISAAGTPPGQAVRVTFAGKYVPGGAPEVTRLVPYDSYQPRAKPRLSDYPDATPVYADGQVIEYTSWDRSGYSVGQVVRYADAGEQDNPADPRVIIRARSGGKPFPVRESQLRIKREREAVR